MKPAESRSHFARLYLESQAEVKRLRATRLEREGEWWLLLGDEERALGKMTRREAMAKAKEVLLARRQRPMMVPVLCRAEALLRQKTVCEIEEVGA